ncbi:MAG TPA: HDOD domain-containing protein [Acidobacteriota bacterium]|nr:HDOD domain-containing protein [Acidobacteriota bacterium]
MNKFVARQPILDRHKTIFAYELLFRSGLENFFHSDEPTQASSIVVDSVLLHGIKSLAGKEKAFLNVTQDILVRQFATCLPKEQAVIEILETVEPNDQVIDACKALKQNGYLIALDDFVESEKIKPLIRLADFIKVDFKTTPEWICRYLVEQYAPSGIKMLAEKVETHEQFHDAMGMGYSYFQGYFFCRPEILFGRDIPAYKLNYLLLLREINREEPDLAKVENVLKRETSLTYKLLRYLNSAAFAFVGEIKSIRHALSLLGLKEIRKWTSLVSLACMADDKPDEVVVNSVVRGKFCENLAVHVRLENRSTELFLMGLLSMMDAILERPLDEILEELPISSDVKLALLNGTNLFRYVYELVLAYERGNWNRTAQFAAAMRVAESSITQAYIDAVRWGQKIFSIPVRRPHTDERLTRFSY